jgi:hypothetical protein
MILRLLLAAGTAALAFAQTHTMTQGAHRMEIMLERLDGSEWRTIDPGLVLASGDRVRFRFRSNFDGYLYVTNLGTSGKYEQLFPRQETGQNNRIAAAQEYQVPATATAFKIAGPPGFETVYWLVSPSAVNEPPRWDLQGPKIKITPRCDDSILKARGACIDSSAGPKLVPREVDLPKQLADAAGQGRRDLLFMRQEGKSVVSSPDPLTGPVIYEFRLAHK